MKINHQNIFYIRVIAILLIATGYGWSGGHFIPPTVSLLAYIFQLIIILLIIILSLRFFFLQSVQKNPKATIGLTIFTSLSLLINIGNIIRGAIGSTVSPFGSHNTFSDLVPIGILIVGNIFWLITLPLQRISKDK